MYCLVLYLHNNNIQNCCSDEDLSIAPWSYFSSFITFLNQARAGRRARACFLKITSVRMGVCVCVRPRGHE